MNRRLDLRRRKFLVVALSALVSGPSKALADENTRDIHIVKNSQCGCCNAWVEILTDKGFNITTENRSNDLLAKFKIESGIPKDMMSCHTAKIDGYFIEGHVPLRDIKRLTAEQPDALGLALPGMPYGSPGMGPEEEREAYDVFIVSRDGTVKLYQHYPKAGLLV